MNFNPALQYDLNIGFSEKISWYTMLRISAITPMNCICDNFIKLFSIFPDNPALMRSVCKNLLIEQRISNLLNT